MEMFLTLVLQVVLAVVVAKLTLAGSRSQKWWERKEELYSSLIEKLYDIFNYNSQYIDDYHTDPDTLSAEQKAAHEAKWEALKEQNRKAEAEVEKLIHIGTFRISDAVHQALSAFKKATRDAKTKYDGWNSFEIVDDICDAAKKCIESVREHSKDDLGLNYRFRRLLHKIRRHFTE